MNSNTPALLVVTGLQREAQIASGDGIVTVCSGGDPALLRQRLTALSAHSRREEIRGVLSFGLAGGLAPHLKSGDIVIASHVMSGHERHDIHAGWHETLTQAFHGTNSVHPGGIAGYNTVVTRAADKAALHKASGAIAVDMESHIAAAYAHRHGLPFAVIRAISDPANRSLPGIATDALTPDGNVALSKVLGGLLRQPGQLPALISAGIDSERAFAALRRCRRLLGPLFGLGGTHL